MSRPTAHDETVVRRAAEKMLDEFKEWIGDSSYSDAELLDDLCEVLRYCGDGYERAKSLEMRGYTPDFRLVELMENADTWASEREAVAEWVKAFDVKPPFPVGTMVDSPLGQGEITKHDETHGLATVFMESKGHVREGTGTRGYLIAWEKLTLLTTTKQTVG